VDSARGEAVDATLDETRPHASIDATRIRALGDKGPERTGRRRELRPVTLERDHGNLKAERPERLAHSLESGSNVSRLFQTGCRGELSAEVLARLAESLLPAASGDLLDQERDQLRQSAVRKFDAFELGRDAVDLGRPPGSWAAPAGPPFERNGQESSIREPIEASAGYVAVRAECYRDFGGGERIAAASRVLEDPPKLRVAGRCKTVERHGRKTYPPEGSRREAERRRARSICRHVRQRRIG
jgi:hypothetical protein